MRRREHVTSNVGMPALGRPCYRLPAAQSDEYSLIEEVSEMRLEEIKQQYPNEWVIIEFTELDAELKVVNGEVIAHSPSRENIEKELMGVTNPQIAIEYTGEGNTGEAFLI